MNKYQEAWNKLDDCSYITDYLSEEKYVLKELVDKATPKKPIKLDKGWYRIGGEWRERIVDCCPNCTQELRYKRCCDDNECRQAIDWSTNE